MERIGGNVSLCRMLGAKPLSWELNMFDMKQSTKYWLTGSICVLAFNVTVFLFRKNVDQTIVLWVVILTPGAWLVLYLLTSLLDRSEKNTKKNNG